jgi:hypothetical protein
MNRPSTFATIICEETPMTLSPQATTENAEDQSRSLRQKVSRNGIAGFLAWTPSRRRNIDLDVLEAWTLVMGREAALQWLADRARLT